MFRQKPAEKLFQIAKEKKIAIIVRVPLASGLLSGKFTKDSKFAPDDHRNYNINGDAFDVGETFSGVNFDKALEAVKELNNILPKNIYFFYLSMLNGSIKQSIPSNVSKKISDRFEL